MEKMIEQVGRAIFQADYPRDNWSRFNPGDVVNERYLLLGRAAIAAMREPSMSVRADEDMSDRWLWICHVCGGPKENWHRIIDAALAE